MAGVPPPPPSPDARWQQPLQLLQPGWTEHVGPQGQLYWHNAALKQSIYHRPSVGATIPSSHGAPEHSRPPPTVAESNGLSNAEPVQIKKEKPAKKEPIPGADGWIRVTTTENNIFYAHPATRRSEWTIPDEVQPHVEEMEAEERRRKKQQARLRREEEERVEQERKRAAEQRAEELRQKAEEERRQWQEAERRKEKEFRKMQEAREKVQQDRLRIVQEASKRKRDEQAESNKDSKQASEGDKRARLEGEEEDEVEDEEEWQRRMAAEMAEEAESNNVGLDRASEPASSSRAPASTPGLQLTSEQTKDVFMHMLTSLNGTAEEVNPMMPWDRELPKFVNHRDYTVISALGDRQDAFNEWCKTRLREKRASVAAVMASCSTATAVSQSASAKPKSQGTTIEDGLASYQQLLESEVKSTRTKWDDFRKEWKRDRRFFAFGRNDREREKLFRAWLETLGERKRKAAEEAYDAFIALLSEHLTEEHLLHPSATKNEAHEAWTNLKKTPGLDRDSRYEAVGSSSRRAELFEEWAKGKRIRKSANAKRDGSDNAGRPQRAESSTNAKRDAESALRARQEQVRREQRLAASEKNRSFGRAIHEESTRHFQQLLLDAVRDPLARLGHTFASLERDERFRAPGLEDREREDLFYEHIENLNERRLRTLQEVFARHAPTLDIDAEHAVPLISDDDEVVLKQLDQLHSLKRRGTTMSDLFEEWQAQRERVAKESFVQMLRENAFVEFWGRLRQEYEHRKAQGGASSKADVLDAAEPGEDDDDADVPSLLQMATQIDLDEVHAVLQHDQRYRAFKHKPEERHRWIRDYLQTMRIPKKTVFQRT